MTEPDPRLQRLLGGDALAGLRQRLRRRFERGAASERFRVGGLGAEEHAALARLLGRPAGLKASLQIDLAALDAALSRAGIAGSLREALERLDGPIVDLAAERRRVEAGWQGVREACREPLLAALLQTPAGLGLMKRLSGGEAGCALRLVGRAEAVLRRLPAAGASRARLAAEALGDAHALDAGRAEAALVLAVLRARAGMTEASETDESTDGAEAGARELWAGAGVLVNELARPALFLNLPAVTGAWGMPGEPAYLSLRALLRNPPRWAVAGRDVYVCENPNLLAIAADALGPRCAPLVCTDGMPAAAQRCLLAQLARSGARLHYHGDFDWPGLRIATVVIGEYGARPWRYAATDYLAAVERAPHPGRPLVPPEAEAGWDPALAPAMRAQGVAVDEEAVAGCLLPDLEGPLSG